MWNWRAEMAADLMEKLAARPVVVPPRGKGRTKEHAEDWTLRHVLATLASTSHLAYPIQPQRGDRPDLVLDTAAGKIGIEATEIMPEAYARAEVIRDREFPGTPVDPSLFRPGKAPTTAEEIRALLRASGGHLLGPGWSGYSAEQEWAEAVEAAIEDKESKLNGPTFGRQQRNWLAIYDNLPTAALDLDVGIRKLIGLLGVRPALPVCFDVITIESTGTLLLIEPTKVQKMELAPLDP